MANELIQSCLGFVCTITASSSGSAYQGKVISIEDNWIKLENKDRVELINIDYIQSIHLLPEKYQK